MRLPLVLLPLLLAGATRADSTTWLGAVSASWHDADNWTNGTPNSGDDVTVGPAGLQPEISNSNVTVASLQVQAGGVVKVLASRELRVNGDTAIQGSLDFSDGNSKLIVSGGDLSAGAGSLIHDDNTLSFLGTCSFSTMGGTVQLHHVALAGNCVLALTGNLNISGDWTNLGEISGNSTMTFSGDGNIAGDVLDGVLSGGLRHANSGTWQSLTLLGGTFELASSTTLTIPGTCELAGGTIDLEFLGFGSADLLCQGPLHITGNVGFLGSIGTIQLHDELVMNAPFSFPDGRFELHGAGSTLAGTHLGFDEVHLVSGVWTLLDDAHVRERLESDGGTSSGPGVWSYATEGALWSTGSANPIHHVRVEQHQMIARNSVVDVLEIVGGELLVDPNDTITVQSQALLSGGLLSFGSSAFGGPETLEVLGDLIDSGTQAGSHDAGNLLIVQGDYTSDGSLFLANGTPVEFPGGGTIGGSAARFSKLVFTGGVTTIATSVEVHERLHTDGGTSAGPEPLLMVGADAELLATTLAPHRVRVAAGQTTIKQDSAVDELELSGGALLLRDDRTLTVHGDALLSGGELGFLPSSMGDEVLDVLGDVVFSGTVAGNTSQTSVVRCAGDWTSDANWAPAEGWARFVSPSGTVTAGASLFARVDFVEGVRTLLEPVRVQLEVTSSGGQTAGDEPVECVGAATLLTNGTNELHFTHTSAGETRVTQTTHLGTLALTGGRLAISDDRSLFLSGDAVLIGGVLELTNSSIGIELLDVEGDVLLDGAALDVSPNSVIECAGDWVQSAASPMSAGTLRLEGDAALRASLPGSTVQLDEVELVAGVRLVTDDSVLSANALHVQAGATLDVGTQSLALVGHAALVDGALSVGAGGELALDGTSSVTIGSTGGLSLIGTPSAPARVGAHDGGGYAFLVDGALEARNFAIAGMGAAGVVLGPNAQLAPAPNDFRGGAFDGGAPGGALLDVQLPGSPTLSYLVFEDTNTSAPANVRRLAGGETTLRNWLGAHGGEGFEDDPSQDPQADPDGLVVWAQFEATELDDFSAKPGPEEVTLSWQTSAEVDVAHFLVDWSTSAAGPWSPPQELASTGGGSSYAFTFTELPAFQELHFRLHQVLTHDPVELLASATATPWPNELPPNVLSVGPGGEHATIQDAIDAALPGATFVSVASGVYDAFTIAAPAGSIHVLPDGSGPVVIDTSSSAVRIQDVGFTHLVELSQLELGDGGGAHEALVVKSCAGAVVIDECVMRGAGAEPAAIVDASSAVVFQACVLDGGPTHPSALELLARNASRVSMGRSVCDALELQNASRADLCQTLATTLADAGSEVNDYPGVMPWISPPNELQPLGELVDVPIETAPGSFWQMYVSLDTLPLDLGDPAFWQMPLVFDPAPLFLIGAGTSDALGQDSLALQLPCNAITWGQQYHLQALALETSPLLAVRFSNFETSLVTN